MAERELSFAEKIRRLRATFLEQLPERMAEAKRGLEALRSRAEPAEAVLSDLRRVFHSMKGAGKSFDFAEIGESAEACEAVADLLIAGQGKADSDLVGELSRRLEALEDVAKRQGAVGVGATGKSDEAADGTADGAAPESGRRNAARTDAARPKGTASSADLVYVCDDDRLQAELIGSQLGYFGYRVRLFTRTADLRAEVEAERPAVVVMDIMFPEGRNDGSKVLMELRALGIAPPAVFISGRKDFEARVGAIRAGGVAYYPKPVDVMALVDTIDAVAHPPIPDPFKILIVDDDREAALYHGLILENAGMTVDTVQRPESVLDAVGSFRPDLVLMDMYMPGCSGREVAALIRQIPEFLSLPIIYLSGETDRDKQFSAMRVGAEGFLTKPIAAQELVNSVSLRAERMRTLHSLMSRDSLTGLFNHTTTTELLRSAMGTAGRTGQSLCFAMIDLDNFKSVNDTWGHPVGDQVLIAVGKVLRQRLRGSDHVGRYGGEEFAVILNEANIETARKVMNDIREDFGRVLFHVADSTFSCTFSCGIAARRPDSTLESLRAEADRNLYQAKDAGRNLVVASADGR